MTYVKSGSLKLQRGGWTILYLSKKEEEKVTLTLS